VKRGALLCLGLMVLAMPVQAGTDWWLATGIGAGAVTPDESLANYRWDTTPTSLYALQATAGRGRFAGGLRLSRWATTQGTGLNLNQPDPSVRLTSFEFLGQARLVQLAGFQLWATGSAGRVGLSYTPDAITIETGLPGGDVDVNYDPITETVLGYGLEIRRDFGESLAVALLGERAGFALDTSHRRGDEIVNEREQFSNWSLRLQVSWVFDLG
jgi:hypothetical protein